MKTKIPLVALAALALALTGCSTVESRIQEKSATFSALNPEQQKVLKEGRVEVGFTEEMAYIALGQPDLVRERQTAQGTVKVWTFLSYSEEYAGTHRTGFRRFVAIDPKTGRAIVHYVPVDTAIYRERVDEVLRVEFIDGKVTAIEQPKEG